MDSLNARGIANWIREERVTVWNGPPPVIYTMAHDDEILPNDLATLNEVWSGGADLPDAIREAFEAKFRGTDLRYIWAHGGANRCSVGAALRADTSPGRAARSCRTST